MPTTYIIGHQKPDTDAVVAPMALAYLYSQKKCFGYDTPVPAITDPLNPETTFLFDKFDLKHPSIITSDQINPEDQIVLADHNEESQRLPGLDSEKIVEIVDHHKVKLDLNTPIFLNFKPWGSTCTIVYFLMKTYQVKPEKKLAAIMLAAILSDTVNFKSATTTDKDKKMGLELAQIAEIDDVDAFALEIFKAKSNVSQLTPEEIVQNDYKVYQFGDKKVFIDQLETVEQQLIVENKKQQLLEAMANVKAQQNVDLLFVVITDILKVNSKILLLGEQEKQIAETAFGETATGQILDIGARMSRKKEIAPPIEKAINA